MPTKNIDYYQKVAERMIKADSKQKKAYDAYFKMYNNEWNLPPELEGIDWIRKVVSTDPHDAIAAGIRVLASLDTKVTMLPLASNQATKQDANRIETALKWELMSANRRRKMSAESEAVKHALLCSKVPFQVIDLEWNTQKMDDRFGGSKKRMEASKRLGRFIVVGYDPRDVHARYSNDMLEAVLLCQQRNVLDVLDEWGDFAKGLRQDEDYAEKTVIYYDYWDIEDHVVWCEGTSAGDTVEIMRGSHDLTFIPWSVRTGGAEPLLTSVHSSGYWETQCVVKTLYASETIAHTGSPRFAEEGNNPETTEVDYGDPARIAHPAPGNTLKPLSPAIIDRAMTEVDDRITGAITKTTVSNILQGGDVPAGTAFATLNLATQTAVGALKPYKQLAEKALADVLTIMLLFVDQTSKAISAYSTDRKNDYGREYTVEKSDFDTTALYLSVELTPDVPSDRQQRANTAALMIQWGYPREYALEDVGVTDPQLAMDQSYYERWLDHNFTMKQEADRAQLQMQVQMQMQQFQQQMQQMQQMQAQAQQQAAQAQQQPAGSPFPGGQAFNPAQGGQPPQGAFPGGTREQVTQQDRQGNPLAQPAP